MGSTSFEAIAKNIERDIRCYNIPKGCPDVHIEPLSDHVLVVMGETLNNKEQRRIVKSDDRETISRIVKTIGKWWKEKSIQQHALGAYDFVHGDLDHDLRPYEVETALINLFRHKGMSLLDLRNQMKNSVYKNSEDIIRMRNVFDVFSTFDRPTSENFDRYWRSGYRYLSFVFPIKEDLQFRLAGQNTLEAIIQLNEYIVLNVNNVAPYLFIRNHNIPEVLMTSAKGRPVTDVIGHEALDIPGLKVTSMRYASPKKQDKIILTMKSVREDANLRLKHEAESLRLPMAA